MEFEEIVFDDWLNLFFGLNKDNSKIHAQHYPRLRFAQHFEKLLQNPSILLDKYTVDQINTGFLKGFLDVYQSVIDDEDVDEKLRKNIIRSTYVLFRDVFGSDAWEERWKGKAGEDGACYMWFDICIGYHLEDEYFDLLKKILNISSKNCQFSALHGLGELIRDTGQDRIRGIFDEPGGEKTYLEKAQTANQKLITVIDEFLRNNPSLEKDIKQFAQRAKRGKV